MADDGAAGPRPLGPGSAVLLGILHLASFITVVALGAAIAGGTQGLALNAVVGAVVGPLLALYVGLSRHAPGVPTAEAVAWRRPAGQGGWAIVALAAVAGAALAFPAAELGARMFQLFPMPPLDPEAAEEIAQAEQLSSGALAVALLGLVLAAPLAEELLYRGFLTRHLAVPGWRRMVLPAMLYAAVTINPRFVPGGLLLALPLGVIMEASGSIVAPWAAHVAHRAAPLLVTALTGAALPDYMVPGETGQFLPLGVSLAGAALGGVCLWQIWRLKAKA